MSLRCAVVGVGDWGLNHVRALSQEPGCDVVALIDPKAEALHRATKLAPRAELYGSLADLPHGAVDAVIIASTAPTHVELAAQALRLGCHVLVEKPMALSIAAGEALLAASQRAQRVTMVGHLMAYHPAVERLVFLLRTGALGKLHYIHSIRANLGKLRTDENALWSFGPHELSMLDLFFDGLPTTVSASGQCVIQAHIEDVVFVTLRYPGGELAQLHLSWLHPRKERRLTLVGADKMAEFDDVASDKLKIYDKGYSGSFAEFGEYLSLRDGDVHIPALPMTEPLRRQLRHFLACIHDGQTPRTSVASGLRITKILAAAQRSLHQGGRPIALADGAG